MSAIDRKELGEDIAAVKFTWPVGMLLVRSIKQSFCELRSTFSGDCITLVLFCVDGELVVLLHGFIKKSRTIPEADLALARKRQKEIA